MPTRGRQKPEQKLQTRIVSRLRSEFDCRVWACPNGGSRWKVEAIALKEMGVEAGAPDLEVIGQDDRTFNIEVKDAVLVRDRHVSPANRVDSLSDSQKRFIPDLRRRGRKVYVVDSIEEALAAAIDFGLRPKPPAAFLTRDAGGF